MIIRVKENEMLERRVVLIQLRCKGWRESIDSSLMTYKRDYLESFSRHSAHQSRNLYTAK